MSRYRCVENACSAFLLALTLHFLWSILFIFCVLAPRGMNAIVLGDEGRSQKATATQKVCLIGIFTCSHITFPMIYSFYFLCVGFTWNEQNRLYRNKPQPSVPFPISFSNTTGIHSF